MASLYTYLLYSVHCREQSAEEPFQWLLEHNGIPKLTAEEWISTLLAVNIKLPRHIYLFYVIFEIGLLDRGKGIHMMILHHALSSPSY